MKFDKPARTPSEHVAIWKSRGLSVDDAEAEHYLRFIGYYRLGGYCIPFQIPNDPEHTFRTGTTFKQVLRLYTFDRELRLLAMDAIERVEVAFRTTVSNHMSVKYGPHWYMNQRLFRSSDKGTFFKNLITIVAANTGASLDGITRARREPEPFLVSYFAKYCEPKLPPSWMTAEVLSLSDWSLIFEEIEKREDRRVIAASFEVAPEVLQSWIHAVAYVRNICAHHGRLWNREFTIKPMIAEKYRQELTPNNRFRAQAFVLNQFMQLISPHTTWAQRLSDHFNMFAEVPKHEMGFSEGWEKSAAWRVELGRP
jgi:abortive infection bacteriophage resistance protein